jgi:hypothetical protein
VRFSGTLLTKSIMPDAAWSEAPSPLRERRIERIVKTLGDRFAKTALSPLRATRALLSRY